MNLRNFALEVDGTLRGRYTSPEVLQSGEVTYSARRLIASCLALGMLYGLCMGSFALFRGAHEPWKQLVASTVKVPVLFLLTLVVTFPSLYVFSALAGSRLTAIATLRLLLIAITVNLAVLAGFGPVIAFFASCTQSYPFIKLLNVALFAIAGVLSLALLRRSLDHAFGDWKDRRARAVFLVWIVVYSVVGAQMGWVLRPFIGTPRRRFEWLRDHDSHFFENVLETLRALFY